MAKAMNVADYVINLCNSKFADGKCNYPISNLYLQKILYFLNVMYLIHTNGMKPLIDERFETWDYGPVLYDVYENYRVYKGNHITHILPVLIKAKTTKDGYVTGVYDSYDFNDVKNIKNFINKHIVSLLLFSPFSLVDKSHEESQWKTRTFRGQLYDNHLSYEYYKKPKNQFWAK